MCVAIVLTSTLTPRRPTLNFFIIRNYATDFVQWAQIACSPVETFPYRRDDEFSTYTTTTRSGHSLVFAKTTTGRDIKCSQYKKKRSNKIAFRQFRFFIYVFFCTTHMAEIKSYNIRLDRTAHGTTRCFRSLLNPFVQRFDTHRKTISCSD